MKANVKARYANGVLTPLEPLDLEETMRGITESPSISRQTPTTSRPGTTSGTVAGSSITSPTTTSSRDAKRCQRCHSEVNWSEAEIHHVKEHHKGGLTQLGNGALVHRACHPKTESEVAAFAESWQTST